MPASKQLDHVPAEGVLTGTSRPARRHPAVAGTDRLLGVEALGSPLARTLSSVPGAVARLGEQRPSDPGDGRAARLPIMPSGQPAPESLQRARSELFVGHLAHLSARERGNVEDALPLLEGLEDHLGHVRDGDGMGPGAAR